MSCVLGAPRCGAEPRAPPPPTGNCGGARLLSCAPHGPHRRLFPVLPLGLGRGRGRVPKPAAPKPSLVPAPLSVLPCS